MHKIKNWFLRLGLGLRITIIVAGVAIMAGAIVAPILIFGGSNKQEEVADNKSQATNKPTTSSDSSEKDKTSESKDKTEDNQNEENPTSTEQGNQNQNTASNNPNMQTQPSNSNNQQNSTAPATTPTQPTTNPTNPSTPSQPSQPSKPSTPIQPTTPTQPETPVKTEAELIAERDQQRRNDMVRMRSEIFNFQANNNGKLPGYLYERDETGAIVSNSINGQGGLVYQPSQDYTLPVATDSSQYAARMIASYLNYKKTENEFRDPDGWTYGLTIIHYDHYSNFSNKNATHMIYAIYQTKCGVATSVLRTDGIRDFSILYKLENGNTYCIDNQ